MSKANEVPCATATRRRKLSTMVVVSALLATVSTSAAFANGQGGVTPVAFPAGQPAIPTGVDCVTVRYYVSEHGRAKSIAWALKNGYSLAQIAEAKRCLRG